MNERKALTTLKHPHLNRLVQTTKSENSIGFLLELAKGVDLYKLLKLYKTKLPSQLILCVMAQVIIALEFIHTNNWVFKDLKASHVFIDKSWRVTLIDFGMSEYFGDQDRSYLAAGTFHQMAPEMIDIWETCIQKDINSHDLML